MISLSRENTSLRSRVEALEHAQFPLSTPTLTTQDHLARDKIPNYIENEINKVPRLITDNPWTLIQFLDKLHLLNGMNEHLFKPIFQRLATYQANSVLLRVAQANTITFQSIAKELLDELTTPHTQLKLVQENFLRTQYDSENFRTYVEQVKKSNNILSQYNEDELVKLYLQGENMRTRAKFQFSSSPKIYAELNLLVAEVEKLELNESMQQPRNTHQSSGSSSKHFSSSHSNNTAQRGYHERQTPSYSPNTNGQKNGKPKFYTDHKGGRNHIIYEDKEWGCRGRHRLAFVTKNSTVVTAQTGGKAILPCKIRHLCDGTVSWIRRRDYGLLTVGKGTYAYDERVQSIHPFNSNEWSLQIKFVEKADAGVYECQVTSHPPESIQITLRVVEARAVIEGPMEKYVKLGSAVDLICVISPSAEIPEFIFWYHNERMINFESDATRVLIPNLIHRKSTIRIQKAGKEHSGNYSCEATNAFPAKTYVHILKEEKPAAMQTNGIGVPQTFWIFSITVPQMLLFLCVV